MYILLALSLLIAPIATAQEYNPEWGKLLDAGKIQQASALCKKMQNSSSIEQKVEAEKCLANVALSRGSQLQVTGNDTGGGAIGTGYKPPAVEEAIKHLNAGLALAPKDKGLVFGKLHVLEVSGHIDEMAKYMDESISFLGTEATMNDWMAYAFELGEEGQAKAGLLLSQVIVKHFPKEHEAVGNVGAFYNMAGMPAEGMPYLKKAVELAPTDAGDVWNLGWAYHRLKQPKEAEPWLLKAMALDPSEKEMKGMKCLYAGFVEQDLKQPERACTLQKASCEPDDQTACKAAAPSK